MTIAARLSHSAQSIERSGIRDVFDKAARVPDVLSLALGEPTETAAAHIVAASENAVRSGHTHYTDILGIPEFRAAAAEYTHRVKGLSYSPETETQVIPGATLGLYLTLRAVLDPGDEVIVPSPAFTSYDAQISLAAGISVPVPLRPENGMRLNAADIERAMTPRTRAVIVNSPSNPTGAVTSTSELERIARVCIAHNVWVISDEVYHPFTYSNGTGPRATAPSIAAVPGMRDRTIIVESLSKTFAMTGWRIGYMHAPSNLIDQTATIAELIHSSINTPAQYAAIAALSGPTGDIATRRARYARQRDLVVEALSATVGLDLLPPEGAFYAFVDIRRTGLSSAAFSDQLLSQWHVAVIPGTAFGDAGEGFVRVSYAGDEAELREGIRRMVLFAEQYSPQSQEQAAANHSRHAPAGSAS